MWRTFDVEVEGAAGRFAHAIGGDAGVISGRVSADSSDHQRLIGYEHATFTIVTQLLLLLNSIIAIVHEWQLTPIEIDWIELNWIGFVDCNV